MKLTAMKTAAAKAMAVGVVAVGLMAAAPMAQAQRFGVRVQFGGPRYVAPPMMYGPAYYPHRVYVEPYRPYAEPYRPYFYGRWHEDRRFDHRRFGR